MPISVLGQVVRLLPGAAAGEGEACCPGVIAATQGEPTLGMVTSTGGKVREGTESGSIGGEQVHGGAGVQTTRYKDH